MKEINCGINNIKNGCIEYYYSLSIETKLEFYNLCEVIDKKINSTIDNYNLNITSIFKNDIEKIISERNIKEYKLKNDFNEKENKLDSTFQKLVRIELEDTEEGLKIFPISELNEKINEMAEELNDDYNFDSKIYGKAFVDKVKIFILPPYKIQLLNNKFVFLKPLLYIFKNKMMVLKISMPIKNVTSIQLFENNNDGYIKKIIDICDIGIDIKEIDFESIKDAYCEYILSSDKRIYAVVSLSKALSNIILADFDGIPQNIKDISEEVKEDLYRIAVAPIQKRKNTYFKDIANQYLATNSNINEGIQYIASKMGRCLSIIDKNIIDHYKEKTKGYDLTEEEIYKLAINSVVRNLEFTLLIILLKNMNFTISYLQKDYNKNDIKKIQKEYNYNNIFILELQQTCYGSVREQLNFFEDKMTYFLDKENSENKMISIDAIIKDEIEEKNLNFQNFLSIGGILLTAVFGLPAIHETLTLLRMSNIIIKQDIPIITIENSSIMLWIFLIVFLYIKLFIKRYKKKALKNIIL